MNRETFYRELFVLQKQLHPPATSSVKKEVGKARFSFLTFNFERMLMELGKAFLEHDVVELTAEVPLRMYAVWKPEHIVQVYANKRTALKKPPHMFARPNYVMGNGMFNDFGAKGGRSWKEKRKMLDARFQREASEDFCTAIPRVMERLFQRLDPQVGGNPLDLYWEMKRLVVDLTFESYFTTDLGDQLSQVTEYAHFCESQFNEQYPFWLPTSNNLKLRRIGRELQELMNGIIGEHRRGRFPDSDLCSLMLASGHDHEMVRAQMMSLFFGTTAITNPIAWSLYLLAVNPEANEKLQLQLSDVLRGQFPDVSQLSQLPYLDMIFNETNRLYPPFWGSLRYCQEPIELNGVKYPGKATFLPIRYFVQHHPDYWENPEAFIPERFSEENKAKIHPQAFLPFGAGPRTCLGVHVAPLFCELIIGAIAQRYKLEFVSRYPNDPEMNIGFGIYPKDKIMMKLSRKSPRET